MDLKFFIKKSVSLIICVTGGSLIILLSVLSGIGISPVLWERLTTIPTSLSYSLLYTLIVFSGIIAAGGCISLIIGAFINIFDKGKIAMILCGIGTIMGFIAYIMGSIIMGQIEHHYGGIYLLFYGDGYIFGIVGILISFIGTLLLIYKNQLKN